MSLVFSLFVPGTPKPQGSKKLVPAGRPVSLAQARARPGAYWIGETIRPAVLIEAVQGLAEWRKTITTAARVHWRANAPLCGPVTMGLVFVFQRPKSHYTTTGKLRRGAPEQHTVKPDLDKLMRAVGDALKDAGVLRDDPLIWQYPQPTKRYGKQSGVHIAIYTVPTEGTQQPLEAVE